MDNDMITLVRQLLLRAGMAMEDVADAAIVSPTSPEALMQSIARIRSAVALAGQLVRSAELLIEYE